MPVQVVPPMYNMLANEIRCASTDVRPPHITFSDGSNYFFFVRQQGKPYDFTHLIIFSRVYHLSEEEESELANSVPPRRSRPQGDSSTPKQNKYKKQRAQENVEIQRPPDGIYSFHPEDDILIKVGVLTIRTTKHF